MYDVDLYRKVRLACHRDGMSAREAALHFGINRRTVAKMLKHSIPPGYQQGVVRPRLKLDPFTAIIDQILQDDADRPKKQRHTAKRILERLRFFGLCDEWTCFTLVESILVSLSPAFRTLRGW